MFRILKIFGVLFFVWVITVMISSTSFLPKLLFSPVMATTFVENFNDLSNCDAVRTNGGWRIDTTTFGFHRTKPPPERSTNGWVNPTAQPQKIAPSGNYAYCANIDGICEIDVFNGITSSNSLSGGNCVDIALSGGYAFVAATNGLVSVKLSTLTQVQYYTGATALGVATRGEAYVGAGSSGLRCVDISDPSSMSILSTATWTNDAAMGVAFYDTFAIVADTNSGIAVVGISDSTAINHKYTTTTIEGGYFVAVSGTLAALAAGDSVYLLGLTEVSDGDADFTPNVLARLGSKSFAYDCEFYGDRLLVADGDIGVSVYNITDPTKAYLMTTLALNASGVSAKGVKIVGSGLIAVADSQGVQFFEVAGLNAGSSWLDTYSTGAGDCAVSADYCGDYCFAGIQGLGLVSIDISDLESISAKDTLEFDGILSIDYCNNNVYVCSWSSGQSYLRIVDVSDPTSITQTNCSTYTELLYDVDIVGNHAFGAFNNSVKQIDLTDWSVDASYSSSSPCNYIQVDGDYVYVGTSGDGLVILNKSDLTLKGSYSDVNVVWGLAKRGDYCYLACDVEGICKVDVSDPANPTLTGGWQQTTAFFTPSGGQPYTVDVFGNYVLVGLYEHDDNDLWILNSSDGSQASICPAGTEFVNFIKASDQFAIVSDSYNGVKIWWLGGEISDSLDQNTELHSLKFTTGTFKFVHWQAWNVYDKSDSIAAAMKDTVTYRLIHYRSGSPETLQIMNINEDPPPAPPLGRGYFNLGAPSDSMLWASSISEHYEVSNPSAADSVWRVDSIEIEYRQNRGGLLRMAGDIDNDVSIEPIRVVFDTAASLELDSLDVPASGGEPIYWEYNGEHFTTVSLQYHQPVPKLELVVTGNITIEPPIEPGVFYIIAGDTFIIPRVLSSGEYEVSPIPAGDMRFPYRLISGWNMVSTPATVPVDISDWGIGPAFCYNGVDYDTTSIMEPGRGYFVASVGEYRFVDGIDNWKTTMPLNRGWNLIGGLSEPASVYSLTTQPENSIPVYCIFTIPRGMRTYDIAESISPRKAYWVFAFQPCTLTIDISEGLFRKAAPKYPEKTAQILLVSNDNTQTLKIGISSGASAEFDEELDIIMPPYIPGENTFGYLRYPGPGSKLLRDIRKKQDSWELVIEQNCRVMFAVNLKFGALSISRGEMSRVLYGGESIDLTPGVYKLVWDTEALSRIPEITRLTKVSPNPFNAAVQISVELAESKGKLNIFDLAGRKVNCFNLSGAGKHSIIWKGNDAHGNNTASGVYFAVIQTDSGAAVSRKLLLIR